MNILISYMYRYWKIIAPHVVLLMTMLLFFCYSTSIVYGDSLTSLTSLGDSSTSGVMIPDGGSVSNDIKSNVNNDLLGVAANFHIFANKATLNTHTNGNLAVDELAGNVNFGTNIHEGTVSKDIYYIGELDSINASSFVSDQGNRTNKVVFGSGVPVYVKSGQVYVKGDERLDHLNSADVYQDTAGSKYIDIKGVLNDLSENSSNLYTKNSDTRLISFVGQDPNSRNIDVSGLKANDNNQTIIDIKASDLEENTPISIKGIAKNSGPIILNVVNNNDDPITGTVNVNSKIQLIYTDGTTRSNHETEDFSDAHILWNFGQSTEVNVNDPFQGSVLAPKADISVGQNLDGNIIGNSVTINAESHRWDFQQGDTPTPSAPVTPTPSAPSTSTPNASSTSTSNASSTSNAPSTSTPNASSTSTSNAPSTSTPNASSTSTPNASSTSTSSASSTSTSNAPSTSNASSTSTPSKLSAHRMNKDDRDKQLYKENKLPQTNDKGNKFLLFIGLVMASLTGVSVIKVPKIHNM